MTKSGWSNVLQVSIAGKHLTPTVATLLVGGWADFAAGVPGAFQLTFRDPKKKVLEDTGAKIGADVVLSPVADGQGAQSPLLTGEVTGLETDYDGTGTFTVIRGYDLGHRMLRQRRVAAYRNMTASDIARKLAGEDRVPVGRIESTTTLYEFVTQANVTDWDFLNRLADENDMVVSLDPKGKFEFTAPDPAAGAPSVNTPGDRSATVLEGGVDILRCRAAVTSADQVTRVEARGWDVTAKRDLVGRAPAADNPGIEIGISPAEAVGAFGTATLVETDIPFDKQGQVNTAARSLAADVTASFAELEVTVRGNPHLRPGMPVTLSSVGTPFEGKYTVTAARHAFGEKHYEVWLTVSGRQWRSLYGLASGGSASGAGSRLPSVANALVTDVKDPLKQGRVKLRFPWLDDMYTSDWTRSVQYGGVGGGGVIAPDVGDEVLVAFDRGALDHPFVIGGLYNGKDRPTTVQPPLQDPTSGRTVRRTLSDRSGNRLDLLDQRVGGKRGVRLSSGDDKLVIDMDRTGTQITVDSKGSVSIKGSRTVTVEAGGNMTLKSGARMSIKSAMLDIEANTISARALAAFSINSLGVLSMNAVGAASVSGEGDLSLTSPLSVVVDGLNVNLLGIVKANGIPVV